MKLNSRDFRIDNYTQDQDGNLLRVTELYDNGNIKLEVVDRSKYPLPSGWNFQPIPITADWLLKLGFTKENEHWFSKDWETLWSICISIDKGEEGHRIELQMVSDDEDSPEDVLWHPYRQIHFIHELQNLYHSIVGEELTLKEEA